MKTGKKLMLFKENSKKKHCTKTYTFMYSIQDYCKTNGNRLQVYV